MSGDARVRFRPVAPHQMGWLRRPECDHHGFVVWERPDGTLYAHDPKQGPLILTVPVPRRWPRLTPG